jgi:hypothetical protein
MDKSICYLCILLVVVIYLSLATFSYHNSKNQYMLETFTNNSPGNYPASEDWPLLSKQYSFTGRKTVSNNNYSDIWWHFPIFKVGSYAQVTNNLKYRRNPDDGTCVRADFCGALYKDNQLESNISKPLPPAPLITGTNTRVNYYTTDENLFMGQQAGPELQTF